MKTEKKDQRVVKSLTTVYFTTFYNLGPAHKRLRPRFIDTVRRYYFSLVYRFRLQLDTPYPESTDTAPFHEILHVCFFGFHLKIK